MPRNSPAQPLDRRHLTYFTAIVELGGITAASERLFVAPAAISRAIREMERKLGVKLFAGTSAGSILTAEGEAILGAARKGLDALNEVQNVADDVRGLRTGSLTVLALPTIANSIASQLLARFRDRCPQVKIILTNPPRPHIGSILGAIQFAGADVGLTEYPGEIDITRYVTTPLPREASWAVFPRTDKPLNRKVVNARKVARRGLVVGEFWESSTTYAELKSRYAGVDDCVVVRTAHRDAIVDLAVNGAGAAVVDRLTALQAEKRGGQIAQIDPPLTRYLVAISQINHMTHAARAFHHVCHDLNSPES